MREYQKGLDVLCKNSMKFLDAVFGPLNMVCCYINMRGEECLWLR